jgi:hypothetical protein
MGTEAGQSLEAILRRKELERRSGDGAFAWGIGNSLGRSADLARMLSPSGEVDVLFTPMKSAAKAADIAPSTILLWLCYIGVNGELLDLPKYSLVTSRGGSERRSHYALLCHSTDNIADHGDLGAFDARLVRNLASSNPVGASQVTSVVRYEGPSATVDKPYRIAFRAKLWAEGFVRLGAPVPLTGVMREEYLKVCQADSVDEWRAGVDRIRLLAQCDIEQSPVQEELFAELAQAAL